MKKILQLVLFCVSMTFTATFCNAQKLELSAGISGNLYNYTGSYAQKNMVFNGDLQYSTIVTMGYGANLTLRHLSKKGLLIAFQGGYDVLRSYSDIDHYFPVKAQVYRPYFGPSPFPLLNVQMVGVIPASGNAIRTSQILNIHPTAGYRVKWKNHDIDFTAGPEISFNIKNTLIESITQPKTETNKFILDHEVTDYRLKGGVIFYYKRVSLTFNYAHGLTNFVKNPYTNATAYSQLITGGISYKLF